MTDAGSKAGGTARGAVAARLRRALGIDELVAELGAGRDEMRRVVKTLRSLDERLRTLERDLAQRDAGAQAQAKEIRLEVRDINGHIAGIRTQLGSRGVSRQLRLLRLDTRALLRLALVDPDELPYPQRLTAQRASLTSQREEDGISWAVFREIGAASRRFIDIGSGMDGGISGFFARECGWHGVMIDANEAHVQALRARFSASRITPVVSFVTRENVNDLVTAAGFAGEVDLFSLDIDGMDYWVWEAFTASSPRLAVLEYNALFGNERAVTVPYEAGFDRGALTGALEKRYYGASLPALVHLAAQKGYRLLTIEPNGLNAFFLRNDVAPHLPACALTDLPYAAVDTSRLPDVYAACREAGLPLVDVAPATPVA